MSIDNANPQTRTTNEKLECQKGTAHSTKKYSTADYEAFNL